MSNIDTLLKKISRTREDLLNHKIYLKLNSEEAIAKFMETHVFAVWGHVNHRIIVFYQGRREAASRPPTTRRARKRTESYKEKKSSNFFVF